MTDLLEQQAEELEALASIYEGDNFFKQLNNTTFQYKYGDENDKYTFNVEVTWTEEYPNVLPKITLDTYYNRTISAAFKTKIIDILNAEGESWLGCGMTYTLFECLKEKLTELFAELEEESQNQKVDNVADNMAAIQLKSSAEPQGKAQVNKKEQLTKAQKKKLWERSDNKGNKVRGWDWVDIIRHLSQTGGKDDVPPTSV
ncbi:hypothetical protein ACKWTF_006985 [Chironomus riparius]